ncbi:DMT family transporter [Mycoplana rhizolycopersici]|uniref:DMT family transporter n=1 Tax=Mycoplana rhizolycopersici TaxID=2746702 RepID=A0ABX2QJJ2_9HYPH|nr:DMT family transporter [Rhizobium rhizolycopersici]NVP56489.1 DMT family transporter [Rhizobium rhizolycopersici]
MSTHAASPRGAVRNEVGLGLALMVVSVLLAPVIDIFSKLAVADVPATVITLCRFVFQTLTLLPIVLWRGSLLDLTRKKVALHAVRGLMTAIVMISFVTALSVMELADALAIFFVEPIILTILGAIFLKETIGWRRYTACAVGFMGALLVIQPSLQEVGPVALLPIVSAFCLAIFFLITRMAAQSEDPWSMQLHTGLWGAGFTVIALAAGVHFGWPMFTAVMPQGDTVIYIVGAGIAATISGIFGAYAYRHAPASVLAPLQYLEIVSATVLGWWVFGDLPDALKWFGIGIIIGSGLYVIWREHRLRRRAMQPPPLPIV